MAILNLKINLLFIIFINFLLIKIIYSIKLYKLFYLAKLI